MLYALTVAGLTNQFSQYNPGGQAPRFLCDTPDYGDSPSRESDVRAAIGAILANKYKEGPSTPEVPVMKQVLDHWGNWLKDATTTSPPDATTFQAHAKIALNVIAGAVARQDKHVLALIPTLHQAASSPHPNGEILARSLGLLVKQNDLLTPDNHAVVKRFHKQWAYSHLTKPLLQPAQPGGSDQDALTAATRYRVAVLSVISNCPFSVYQDDLSLLIRLLVTALAASSGRTGVSDDGETTWSQTAAALEVLVEILTHEPGALTGYLREVIGGVTGVYQECSSSSSQKKEKWGAARTALCRRLALQVLGAIPSRFEERHVRAYAPPTQRMLAGACGDPVRRVREVARAARASWARVD
jgi:DNA repair/transcription protein MET18/MMS19